MSQNEDLRLLESPERNYKKRIHEIFDSFLELLPKSLPSFSHSELNRITNYLDKIYDSKDLPQTPNNAPPTPIINHYRIHNIHNGPIFNEKQKNLENIQKPIHSNKFLK